MAEDEKQSKDFGGNQMFAELEKAFEAKKQEGSSGDEPGQQTNATQTSQTYGEAPQGASAPTGNEPSQTSSGEGGEQPSGEPKKGSEVPDSSEIADLPKSAKDWKAIKSQRDSWKQKAEEMEQKLQEFEQKRPQDQIADDGTMDKLRQERDQLYEQLQQVAIERDPQFVQQYQEQEQGAIERAKKAVGGEYAQQVEQALSQASPQHRDAIIEDIQENLSQYKASRLAAAVDELDKVRDERDTKIKKSRDNWQQLQQQQQQQQQERYNQALKTFETVWKKWEDPEEGLPFLQRDGENDSEVDKTKKLAQRIMVGDLSVEEAARASGWAALAPTLLQQLSDRDEQLQQMEQELQQYRGSQPGLKDGGSSGGSQGESTGGKKQGESFAEYAVRKARENPNSKFSRT